MLQGINNQSALYANYNRIQHSGIDKDDSLLKLNGQQVKEEQAPELSAKVEPEKMELRLDSIKPRQNLSLEDISLSLNEPKAFEMKGKDSDIESLDMEKAVSDMQKDQALQQYQFFVGDANSYMKMDEGIVIAK